MLIPLSVFAPHLITLSLETFRPSPSLLSICCIPNHFPHGFHLSRKRACSCCLFIRAHILLHIFSFWKANERPLGKDTATVLYPVTTQTADFVFTTTMPFYVCVNMSWDAVFGRDFMELCSQSSGPFHSLICINIPYLCAFSLDSPLYHIHDENIHFLNNFILLARNGSETANVDDGPSSSHAKRRPYVPYDYQGSSSCTLEDAAASLRSSEPDHSGMFLLQDILLKYDLKPLSMFEPQV